MKMSVLEALFYGKISPWERRVVHSRKRTELEQKIDTEKRYFIEKMSLDDCERFQSLEGLYAQASEDEEKDIFSYGFALGSLIMLEVLEAHAEITNEYVMGGR